MKVSRIAAAVALGLALLATWAWALRRGNTGEPVAAAQNTGSNAELVQQIAELRAELDEARAERRELAAELDWLRTELDWLAPPSETGPEEEGSKDRSG